MKPKGFNLCIATEKAYPPAPASRGRVPSPIPETGSGNRFREQEIAIPARQFLRDASGSGAPSHINLNQI